MSASSEIVSKAEYARLRGCAPSAISRALKEGRINTTADGRIDVKKADKAWREGSRSRGDSNSGGGRRQEDEEEPLEVSYSDARARREHLNAQQAELNLQIARGKVIDAVDAQKAVLDAFRELRNALERLPRRLAGLVLGLSEPREAERIVDRELKAVLDAFARPTTEALQRRNR